MRKQAARPKIGFRFPAIILWVAVFAVIGAITLLLTKAATSFSSLEPEQGALSSPAATVADGLASGGSAVQFGGMVTPPSGSMKLVSRGVPLFTATNNGSAEAMRDTSTTGGWDSSSLPSWAAGGRC